MKRSRHWSSNSRKSYRRYSSVDFARRHVEEAERLSIELGGMDKEVKSFFFTMPSHKLTELLSRYGHLHGEKALEYAIQTFPHWRAGTRRMSGLIAGRLFALLPPLMPFDLKLKIVEGLWEKQNVQRTDYLLVPYALTAQEIVSYVGDTIFSDISGQSIPASIKQRFDWLSGEDAQVAEQLFRHVRQTQLRVKQKVAEAILTTIEATQAQNADVISDVVKTIEVEKHSVSIKRSMHVDQPKIVTQYEFQRGGKIEPSRIKTQREGDNGWVWWLAGAGLLAYLLFK